MKKFNIKDINSPNYWDGYYSDRQIDFENTLRQDFYWELTYNKTKVVELGCGLSPFILRFAYGFGLDFAPKTIEFLQKKYPFTNWTVGNALDTPYNDESFDAVVAGEIIEHLPKPEMLLEEMNRICKVGGVMVLSTPILEFEDPEHLWEFDEAYFTSQGFTVRTLQSEKFPGRSYIFAWKTKQAV